MEKETDRAIDKTISEVQTMIEALKDQYGAQMAEAVSFSIQLHSFKMLVGFGLLFLVPLIVGGWILVKCGRKLKVVDENRVGIYLSPMIISSAVMFITTMISLTQLLKVQYWAGALGQTDVFLAYTVLEKVGLF